jgi:hypothetical protein
MDETLETPVLEEGTGDKAYYTECFIGNDRILRHDHTSRLYKYKNTNKNSSDYAISSVAYAGLCPDFSLNQPYYN